MVNHTATFLTLANNGKSHLPYLTESARLVHIFFACYCQDGLLLSSSGCSHVLVLPFLLLDCTRRLIWNLRSSEAVVFGGIAFLIEVIKRLRANGPRLETKSGGVLRDSGVRVKGEEPGSYISPSIHY